MRTLPCVLLLARPFFAARDEGYLYGRGFFDLDGHCWEVTWMDPVAVA